MTQYGYRRPRSAGETLAKIILWTLAVIVAPIVLMMMLGVGLMIAGAIEAYG